MDRNLERIKEFRALSHLDVAQRLEAAERALAQIARLSSEGEVSTKMQYALGDIARMALTKVQAAK